jgi:hypothetical protein
MEDEDKVEEEDEDKEEDKDEDDRKEPRMIAHGKMINTSADITDTMVDDEPAVLPQHGQQIGEHTAQPQPPLPAARSQTPEPPPRPLSPETNTCCGMEVLGLLTPGKPRPAGLTQGEAEAVGNISDVNVNQRVAWNIGG